MNQRIAIVDGIRTPFVKAFGEAKDISAFELGRIATVDLLERARIDKNLISEVIFGNWASPYEALNPARVIAVQSKLPVKVTAYTVGQNCDSGIRSITSAHEKIQAGNAEIIIAGGAESMSSAPVLFGPAMQHIFYDAARAKSLIKKFNALIKLRPKHFKPSFVLSTANVDILCGLGMGETAEIVAKEFKITRGEQDRFAFESHKKALAATQSGKLAEEIVPIFVPPKYNNVIDKDIGMREDISLENLAKLKPYYDREYGTITVGNSSMLTDGAAALLIMKEEQARAMGYEPLGYIKSYAYTGLNPKRMVLGGIYASYYALKKAGLKSRDLELIEMNEAFATVMAATEKCFSSKKFSEDNFGETETLSGVDMSIVNVNGGAIALGHPIAASGTRLVLTLLKEMRRRNLKLGLAALCAGGGQGGAMILER